MTTRSEAQALDRLDPLAAHRAEFAISDPELVYFDGNSLGRLPRSSAQRMRDTIDSEWGTGLVRSWHDWLDLPVRIGDTLGPLIGARPGEVVLGDQTSVNLYKLAHAALGFTKRRVIVSDTHNFPSDLYVLDAVARAHGGELRLVDTDELEGPTPESVAPSLAADVGLLSLSVVAYRSAALCDVAALSALAHDHGALTLFDASHAAGAVPLALHDARADLAVGCTYKYLNGGPGAPAFLYVRDDLQDQLESPIPGWFGHDDLFAFEPEYRPAPGVRRFTVGTPPIVSLRGAESGIALAARVGIDALHQKSRSLSELFLERFDQRLAALDLQLASPRDSDRRGSHVSLRHPDGYRVTQALAARNVLTDFRPPDTIRFGFAPLYNTHVQVWDAVEFLAETLENGAHEHFDAPRPGQVT